MFFRSPLSAAPAYRASFPSIIRAVCNNMSNVEVGTLQSAGGVPLFFVVNDLEFSLNTVGQLLVRFIGGSTRTIFTTAFECSGLNPLLPTSPSDSQVGGVFGSRNFIAGVATIVGGASQRVKDGRGDGAYIQLINFTEKRVYEITYFLTAVNLIAPLREAQIVVRYTEPF